MHTLQDFLHRSAARALYRQALKRTRRLADKSLRDEIRREIRSRFDANSHVADVGARRRLLADAQKELAELDHVIAASRG